MAVCPTLLTTGSCGNSQCTQNHDLRSCDLCGVLVSSDAAFASHLLGRKHAKKLARPSAADIHPPSTIYCHLCDINVPEGAFRNHETGRRHFNKQRFYAFKSVFEEAEKDKHGITVSHLEGIDFGVVEVDDAKQGTGITLLVNTSIPLSRTKIAELNLSSASSRRRVTPTLVPRKVYGTLRLKQVTRFSASVLSTSIVSGLVTKIYVKLLQPFRGRYQDRLEIILEDTQLNHQFIIVRQIQAIVGNAAEHKALQPIAPYVPKTRTKRQIPHDVIPGEVSDVDLHFLRS